MKNVKNNNGITLMALVITIIILIILASIGTYSGIQVVKSAQFTAFSTELKIMQTQVNKLYEEKRNGNSEYVNNLGTTLSSNTFVQEQANNVFTQNASGITDTSDYKYYNTDTIKSLNIEGVEGEFFVNIDKRSVISYEGFEYEGTTYYTLNQLPDSLYNVEFEEKNTWNNDMDSFKVSSTALEQNKYKITVSDIDYKSGNINKWKVKYKKEEQDNWNETDSNSFIIDEVGNYRVKIANNNVESNEKQIKVMTKSSSLPIEFQELDYIESTGTQYIDTGITPDEQYGFYTDIYFSVPIDKNSSSIKICGSSKKTSKGWAGFFISSYGNTSGGQMFWFFAPSSQNTVNPYLVSNKRQQISCINDVYYSSNNNINENRSKKTLSYINGSVYLFALHADDNQAYINTNSKLKMYRFKTYRNSDVIQDMIPCYRISDCLNGMYDIVEGKFYTNQGSGTFIRGNDNNIIINDM